MISEQIWWIFWWHAISPDSKNVPIESCQIFQDLPVLGLILLAVSWCLAMILCFSFAHLCKFIIHLCLAAEMADSWGWLTHEGWTNMLRVETYTLLDLIADMGNWFLREEGLFHWPYFLVITCNYFNFKFETRFWEAGQQEGQSFHKLHLWRHQQNHLVISLEDSRTKHGKTKVSLVSLLLQSFQLSKQEKNTFKITIKNTRSETMEEGSKITPTWFVSTPCPPKFAWMSHHLHAKSTWEAMGIMVGSWWMRQKNHEFLYIVYTD